MTLLRKFIEFIHDHQLFQKNDRLFLAVSGGIDSVALCELCKQAGFSFEIAHCNFNLRGSESQRDEHFVKQLAVHYGVPFHVNRFDTEAFAAKNKISTQVAARELRYSWFESLINEKKVANAASYVLTAHHANDAVETLLMNFFKGTGIRGLHGIAVKKDYILRPLLFARRKELLEFVSECNLNWVEDSSNVSDKYTRNYFRNQLVPAIQKVFPEVEDNLVGNLQRFREAEILYDLALATIRRKLIVKNENEIRIPVLKLLETPATRTVLFEITKDFNFLPGQLDDILNLSQSESGKYVASETHRIIRDRKWLIITPIHTPASRHILIDKKESKIMFEEGVLHIEEKEWSPGSKIPADADTACLDTKNILYPLILRRWKQGDYFYPLGMQKKKKVSRFLIDQKISVSGKEKVWVLESQKKILWVIGMRIDDRFKVGPATKAIMKISYNPGTIDPSSYS